MILIGAVIVALALAIVLFFSYKNKEVQETKDTPKASAPDLSGMESSEVNDQDIGQAIKEKIEKSETSGSEMADIEFKDTKNQPLTLNQFETGADVIIKPEIYGNLSQTDFSVFTCSKQLGNAEGLGLIMRFKAGSTAAYYADLYDKMNKNLISWEDTMFNDLSPLLFPGEKNISKPVFKSTEYETENGLEKLDIRYANVKSDSGKNLSIDYTVYAEDIYIFNNPQCLRKVLDKYEPVGEP